MEKRKVLVVFFLGVLSSYSSHCQNLKSEELKSLTNEKFNVAFTNLHHFLKLQNDGNYRKQIDQNKHWCDSVFTKLNFKTQTIKTDGAPLLLAEKIYKKNFKSILFYLQIDGQPVDSSAWSQPDPFTPIIKELKNGIWSPIKIDSNQNIYDDNWRIFARSASDSKGPAMSLISALQILQKQNINPQYNIKVIMDFQEELGSPDLPKAVLENKDLLSAEMLFIMDGTRHLSNLPTLTYGARGITTATIKVFGPKYALHSGQYGNYAPNPVFEAARLISSLKDERGIVQIPGFYDGVILTARDKQLLATIPENNDSLIIRLGISKSEEVAPTYQEALQYPSLNIRGLKAAYTGIEVRTLIPEDVIIEIDMRLVPETPAERQLELLRNHIMEQGYHLVDSVPSSEDRATFKKLASLNTE
ncbi:M20/M25/M40 family metallo-hydrolase [uncultured Maribacter sp.]|uniref:M20/M25/M40 family metallo-hydrolase n=1 Tax=uncultured Maribacter sp. TaxID=431308 RepID=UPI0030ED6640|tara:strand:+ start:57763 stop:59010 length:1248 start_codon:yes stop_codon:yes gene_type:complete